MVSQHRNVTKSGKIVSVLIRYHMNSYTLETFCVAKKLYCQDEAYDKLSFYNPAIIRNLKENNK